MNISRYVTALILALALLSACEVSEPAQTPPTAQISPTQAVEPAVTVTTGAAPAAVPTGAAQPYPGPLSGYPAP